MKKSLASGHSSNLVSLRSLVPCAVSYGDSYNPSKPTIKISSLQSLITDGENTLELVTNLEVAKKNVVDARDSAFKLFNPLLTSINSIVRASDTSVEVRTHVGSIIRSIRGAKLRIKKTEIAVNNQEAAVTEKNTVVSHKMGYDIRLENFDKLIQYLESVPTYTPNEPRLTIAGLTDCYNDLKNKISAAVNADVQLTQARKTRKAFFYAPSTGLAIAGNEAKNYIKAVFGVKSIEYKQVSKLKFRIYKS